MNRTLPSEYMQSQLWDVIIKYAPIRSSETYPSSLALDLKSLFSGMEREQILDALSWMVQRPFVHCGFFFDKDTLPAFCYIPDRSENQGRLKWDYAVLETGQVVEKWKPPKKRKLT